MILLGCVIFLFSVRPPTASGARHGPVPCQGQTLYSHRLSLFGNNSRSSGPVARPGEMIADGLSCCGTSRRLAIMAEASKGYGLEGAGTGTGSLGVLAMRSVYGRSGSAIERVWVI